MPPVNQLPAGRGPTCLPPPPLDGPTGLCHFLLPVVLQSASGKFPSSRGGPAVIIPTPHRIVSAPGRFTLDRTTAVHAPGAAAAAADLLRTLLRPATGLPLAPS